jgi:UDP-N-acetylglucosamine 2-epimerase (non-hydrolysing)
VARELRASHDEVMVHTGQHYGEEMSTVFFEELELPEPDYNLGLGSCTHGEQTARCIKDIEEVIRSESPDMVLVYGNTNSTLAGAIAASKTNALLAHVEAGLRSYDREMSEEVNQVLADHAADVLFAPSERSA